MKYQCPSCNHELEWSPSNQYRPFCSDKCKNKDFIQWANEEHKIEGSSVYDDMLSSELDITDMAEYRKTRLDI